MSDELRRGTTLYADLTGNDGSEMGNSEDGHDRLCVVIQNDGGNISRGVTIVAPMTTAKKPTKYKEHVHYKRGRPGSGVTEDSVIDCGQIRTIDNKRIRRLAGKLDKRTMKLIDAAICASLGIRVENAQD